MITRQIPDDYRHRHLFNPQTGYSPTEMANVFVLAPTLWKPMPYRQPYLSSAKKTLIESLPEVDALFVTKDGRLNIPISLKLRNHEKLLNIKFS